MNIVEFNSHFKSENLKGIKLSIFQEFQFYWVREGVLAGSSRPKSVEDLHFIADQGIKRIISISAPNKIKEYAKGLSIEVIPMEFENYMIPTENQLKNFFSIMKESIKEKKPVLVHCQMGCGRTGLLLTSFVMKFEKKDFNQSLYEIRKIRPCAVETEMQLEYLESLYFYHY